MRTLLSRSLAPSTARRSCFPAAKMRQRPIEAFFVKPAAAKVSSQASPALQGSMQPPGPSADAAAPAAGASTSSPPRPVAPQRAPPLVPSKRSAPEAEQGTTASPSSDAGNQKRPATSVFLAGSAPSAPRVLLPADMQALAEQHLALCRQRCAAARQAGAPLALSDLLVEPSWAAALAQEMGKPSFAQLSAFVAAEYKGSKVFPPQEMIFRAFNSCPLDQVRVVVLGQDPYPGDGQAMGLCFSVNRGVKVPQSLHTIYRELERDCGCAPRKHGDLSSWCTQGVLMLNTMLTVRAGKPMSHAKQGWEALTDAAIGAVSRQRAGVVFLLWGKPAQAKAKLVNESRHHVLRAPHPSPLAAASGHKFEGCGHFGKANALLQRAGWPAIDWQLPE